MPMRQVTVRASRGRDIDKEDGEGGPAWVPCPWLLMQQFPGKVFSEGAAPDPRFTFANERTFLAWIRTSLALLAAGVALEAFVTGVPEAIRRVGAVLLVLTGIVMSVAAYSRWAACERALRRGRPLPAPTLGPIIAYAVAGVGLLAGLLVLLR